MMKQVNIYVDSSTELPSKYARLQEASLVGLQVPNTLLIDIDTSSQTIEAFLAGCNDELFIVRSANKTEDGSAHSLAGHFWSSAAVAKEQVLPTVQLARTENERLLVQLGLKQPPCLMLQAYIQHHLGGVLFVPWGFFSEYAYLEYSKHGVEQVVAGQASAALLSLDPSQLSPMPLTEDLVFLEPLLRELAKQLKQNFKFPVDCEWAYSAEAKAIIVLQIRSQTHLIGALLPLPSAKAALSPWQFTALSESLAKLSPLSFSLIQALYTQAIPALRLLGCKAKQVDFLAYQADGTVLVDPKREQAFFEPTLMGGFWRGLRAAEFKAQAEAILASIDPNAVFSEFQLSRLFTAWLIQNLLSQGQGREQAPVTHAYELSWLEPEKDLDLIPVSLPLRLRQAFLLELNKLKRDIAEHKERVFCLWEEYKQQNYSQVYKRQHEQAQLAIYDHAIQAGTHDFLSLAASKQVQGVIFKLSLPFPQTLPELPAACILASPYFDNRWVQWIPQLAGIIVMQGGRLSHSAIVAREYSVPYAVISPTQFAALITGMQVELNTLQACLKVL